MSLSAEIIAEYEAWRKKAGVGNKLVSVPVSRILGKGKLTQKADQPQRYWRTCIDGTLDPKTETVLDGTFHNLTQFQDTLQHLATMTYDGSTGDLLTTTNALNQSVSRAVCSPSHKQR